MIKFVRGNLRAIAVAACLAAAAAAIPAYAAYEQQAAETKAYAMKAVEFYRAKGFDASKTAFLTPKAWFLGPDHFNLHVSAMSNDQMVWADSGFPEVVGQSYKDVEDLDGVPLGKTVWDGLAKSPGGAALQLRFSNPVTKAVAHTEGYCINADASNVICAWSQTN